ncbi:MAG: L-threonylcarbamoyladenylate synthase [Candidatus Omnitrophota bacterium]
MNKKTKIFKINPENPDIELIKQAAQILKDGGLVAFPTETVYGLAAITTQDLAVEKLRYIKQRNEEKKFSLCIYDTDQVLKYVKNVSTFKFKLMKKFWPRPLTLVLNGHDNQLVGLRIPDHPVTQLLLRETRDPVYGPSANFAGEEPALSAEDVLESFDGRIDAVIDSGESKHGISSTVCEIDDQDQIKILREGVITEAQIEKVKKTKNILFVCTGNSCRSAIAEGLMKKVVKDNDLFEVSSAGVAAYEGMPASPEAIEVAKKRNADISAHKARRLTQDMVRAADLILVMEQKHQQYILNYFTKAEKKIILLKQFFPQAKGILDIQDPIGRDLNFYDNVAEEIEKSIEGLMGEL